MPATLPVLETERLILRPRATEDLDQIALLNADPQVMRHIAPLGSPAMSRDGVAARSFSHVALGLGHWSVFARADEDAFLGYVGLIPGAEDGDDPQLSYRFGTRHWGKGYAFEASARLVDHGIETLALPAVAILTHPQNEASCRLAHKLGFTRLAAASAVLIGDPPVPGASFRLSREDWREPLHAASGLNAR
ncbi:GNAT family N-acetyltransferase [Bosea sp. 685]|uniref:GNAT family N-acetyltransferase n=1 Tax=Bosea sp. 685 TaxID=3080057 RepID=UPI002892C3D1|nr:GNAT family N-acetyltransferase [Bosea sp. 685]WNJ88423.1 GNAT family N-acetyltransferase [Bosea sp. 685]